MRPVLALLLGGVLSAGLAPGGAAVAGGDPKAGRKIANMCRTCHGIDGYAKIPIAPHIGGEPQDYLEAQLRAFRSGTREHEMMSVVAAGLSDTQIENVAAWYAAHRARASLTADPAGAPEDCVACHGADGIATAPHVPNLAGEVNVYIETQLKAFRTGKRTHEVMSGIAADLTDAQIQAAADWYAAVGLEIAPPD